MRAEIIPKFINLLMRDRPLIIHGDGLHSRRYLYAGDAADAFDTILHKGQIGQTYNVDSRDEFTNLELAHTLLSRFGRTEENAKWIEYTRDRPFNDRRYAVDGSKLRQLGWKQKTSFDEGLRATIDWYEKFGNWWGTIENVLTGHPVVKEDQTVVPDNKDLIKPAANTSRNGGVDGDVEPGAAAVFKTTGSNGSHRPDEVSKVVKKGKMTSIE